ncbi:MAG: class I SAM-dependent methyltransferase [Vulcanimicrobiaceae bacterium]
MTTHRWDPAQYHTNAAFVPALGGAVLELLAPAAGERILDLGCGDGVLTGRLVAAGAHVVAVDSSAEMIAAANARGIEARVVDARELPYEREFDAVFSNAALHWIQPPDQVVAGIARALRGGGRFVAEFGGFGNVAAIVSTLGAAVAFRCGTLPPMPWYFPTPAQYADLLVAGGFRVEQIESIARPTLLPTGMRGWLETFAQPYAERIEPAQRGAMLDEVVQLLEPSLRSADGAWYADYVRLRFRAIAGS